MAEDKTGPQTPAGGQLGTFAGVFTPSVLTILGIILFLRLGYVVGAAGLTQALVIILLANLVSVLTSLSLSAIATNYRVKGGGDYYLISRTLGAEHGGSIGIVLFLAQSVSIAFYAIGFGEAIAAVSGHEATWFPQAVAAAAVAVLFVLAWIGADAATRFQFVIMGVLGVALGAFFIGGFLGWDPAVLRSNWARQEGVPEIPFWAIFAIFFPAVTGFTQGVSMSGDLKDPGKSLPVGTFLAVGISAVVYFGAAILFAGNLPGTDLVSDYGAMQRVSIAGWLIHAGVIAATISSALASFLGAPRILQSLARDRLFPALNPFGKGYGAADNPRRGVLLSLVIAFATIALGDLNLIAPVVSMFFLISYGLLNYATYFEASGKSPSFRPRFKWFHHRLSLIGALGCAGAMIAIHPLAGGASIVILLLIQQYIRKTVAVARWADGSRSNRLQQVRDNLHFVRSELDHPRDWRPVILAFSDNPDRRERIIRFASWIEGGSGFTTAVKIMVGEGAVVRKARDRMILDMRADIRKRGLEAFTLVVATPDFDSALPIIMQAHGMGPVRPNTVLMNWFDRSDGTSNLPGLQSYGRYVRMALRFGQNVIMLAVGPKELEALEERDPRDRRIDVWYRDDATGRLMLMAAYLMTRTPDWRGAPIRLLVPVTPADTVTPTAESIEQMLDDVRIEARFEFVEVDGPLNVAARSSQASVVFFPFDLVNDAPSGYLGCSMEDLAQAWMITAFVLAAQDLDLEAEPEEGTHGLIAEARDAADKLMAAAKTAQAEAERAQAVVDKLEQELVKAREEESSEEAVQSLADALAEAREEAEELRRRAAKNMAKAEAAEREAKEKVGAVTADSEGDEKE